MSTEPGNNKTEKHCSTALDNNNNKNNSDDDGTMNKSNNNKKRSLDDIQQEEEEEKGKEKNDNNKIESSVADAIPSSSSPSSLTPITPDGEMPQKKFYRQRAHCNPLSHNDAFDYPLTPNDINWTETHYPNANAATTTNNNNNNKVIVPTVLDIGCGFGGLTLALATLLPNEYILGMEIRAKVTEYVRLRIVASRKEGGKEEEKNNNYENCSVMRTNSMKFLPHYFHKGSINKLFFCFADPHFKRKNWGRRIISDRLLAEYAFVLKVGGKLYCITDVKELQDWQEEHCDAHPLFRKLSTNEMEQDPCVHAMQNETEEGKKVTRNKGNKYYAVYERIENNNIALNVANFFYTKK